MDSICVDVTTEMLAKFTEVEKLDGQIYACDRCNSELSVHCFLPFEATYSGFALSWKVRDLIWSEESWGILLMVGEK